MELTDLKPLRLRADLKLRFAEIAIDELAQRGPEKGMGDDFEKAHQESFLHHLLGAKEAFLRELNAYYGANLPEDHLSIGKLQDELHSKGKHSPELAILRKVEEDSSSWLYRSKRMRDESTHVRGLPRTYYPQQGIEVLKVGAEGDSARHFLDEFREWHAKMKDLLEELRNSAIEANR